MGSQMSKDNKTLEELNLKVEKHEWELTHNRVLLEALKNSDKKQWERIRGIKHLITIVKWTCIGIAMTLGLKQLGLTTIFKLLGV